FGWEKNEKNNNSYPGYISAIQRFSDGIIANPGDIPGVGGPVDVAIITADQGFLWVSRKKLKIESLSSPSRWEG
ncbi:unnamed protein product, partial [marine sediment metagenome]